MSIPKKIKLVKSNTPSDYKFRLNSLCSECGRAQERVIGTYGEEKEKQLKKAHEFYRKYHKALVSTFYPNSEEIHRIRVDYARKCSGGFCKHT